MIGRLHLLLPLYGLAMHNLQETILTAVIGLQATHGCGDLVFSSHTIFALAGMMTYNEYGSHLATKVRLSCLSDTTLARAPPAVLKQIEL